MFRIFRVCAIPKFPYNIDILMVMNTKQMLVALWDEPEYNL